MNCPKPVGQELADRFRYVEGVASVTTWDGDTSQLIVVFAPEAVDSYDEARGRLADVAIGPVHYEAENITGEEDQCICVAVGVPELR